MGPSWQDWALLSGSGAFVAAAIHLYRVGDDPDTAIATGAFFGLCTLIAVFVIAQKLGLTRHAARPGPVGAVGGATIRQDRRLVVGMGAALLVTGVLLVAYGGGLGLLFQGIGAVIGGTGAVTLGLLAAGRVGDQWLRFDVEGLRIGAGARSYLVHWDNFGGLQVGELNSNTVLFLAPLDLDRLLGSVEGPGAVAYRAKLARHMHQSIALHGWPLMLMPFHFGLDAGLLARAILRYAADPAARAELGQRVISG